MWFFKKKDKKTKEVENVEEVERPVVVEEKEEKKEVKKSAPKKTGTTKFTGRFFVRQRIVLSGNRGRVLQKDFENPAQCGYGQTACSPSKGLLWLGYGSAWHKAGCVY